MGTTHNDLHALARPRASEFARPGPRAALALILTLALAPACDSTPETPPDPAARFDELVAGKSPRLPAPLASLQFGSDLAAARAAAPTMFTGSAQTKEGGATIVTGELAEFGCRVRARFSGTSPGYLDRVDLLAPEGHDPRALATKAWGAPAQAAGVPGVDFWFDESHHLRVTALDEGGARLRFEPFLGVGELVAPKGGADTSWSPARVLGQPLTSVARRFPSWTASAGEGLSLPPLKYNPERTAVQLETDDAGLLHGISIPLGPVGAGQTPVDVSAAIDGVFPSRQVIEREGEDDLLMWFAPAHRVRATGKREGDALTLELCSYSPLADLLDTRESEEHPLGRPLLGASADELREQFEDRLKFEGEAAQLTLDATDYGRCSDQAFVRMFLAGGRVNHYELRISYAVDPSIATLVRARLDKIYGVEPSDADAKAESTKPKKAPKKPQVKTGTVRYSRSPQVTLHDSSSLKVLSIEVKG